MVRWYRFLAVMGGAALMLASPWAVGTASAEPPSQNCVYDLQPVDPLQTSGDILTVPVQQGCYSTYSHAVAAGSSQGSTRGNDSLLPAADVLIGTEWVNRFFGGNSNSYFASDTCSSNVSWSVAYVGDQWNDVFSSGKGFGGCNTNKKFQDASFGGSASVTVYSGFFGLTSAHLKAGTAAGTVVVQADIGDLSTFFYEWVEGVFRESADTVEGKVQHGRVDAKSTRLPTPEEAADEEIHSRSVTLSSERLRVIAKLDLLEGSDGVVTPVDYKHGRPVETAGGLDLWPTDRPKPRHSVSHRPSLCPDRGG